MKAALIALLSSMKFLTTVLGIVTALAARYGFHVDPDTFWMIAGLFVVLLTGQGLTDHGKAAAQIAAKSDAAAVDALKVTP